MKRIVILLLVITGLYIIFQQSFSLDWFAAGNQDGKAAVSDNINTIVVNVSGVNASIIPESRDNVKAVLEGRGKLTVKENGDTIEVSVKKKWFDWFDWSPFTKKSLKIYIPNTYDRYMSFNVGSGNLRFSGHSMKLDELKVEIGSGNINLNHLTVNRFNHDGGSGNVNIDSLKTKTSSFDLSSGSLDVKHYTGALKANVASGSFDIQMDKLTDSVDIDLSSGNVSLDLPNNADFNLYGDVSSGHISCDIPLTSKQLNSKNIKGTHGSGTYKVKLSVSSGNIHVH